MCEYILLLPFCPPKVPYELLNKKFRAGQKGVDRELNQVTSACNELASEVALPTATAEEVGGLLDTVSQRVSTLKRKVRDSSAVREGGRETREEVKKSGR